MPTALDGVSVRLNGQALPLAYVSPGQLNVLAPEATADGTAQLTVTSASGMSDPVTVAVKRLMPAFFQLPDDNVVAVRADGSLAAPRGLFAGVTTVPARPGETLMLYGTGFGAATGTKIHVHERSVAVPFAGLVSPGLNQVNIVVPDLPDGDYPLTAETGGVRTAKFLKLRIQRTTTARAEKPLRAPVAPYREVLARARRAARRTAVA